MILRKGLWSGRGSVLTEGASLGQSISLDVAVVDELDGLTITGEITDSYTLPLSMRIAPNEVGTYVIDARLGKVALDGIAKLESEPNHALLWHESGIYSASVSLFSIGGGLGCRGFFRDAKGTLTWEMQLQSKQQAVGGANVVSLARRRR
ncbi:MAG: hypothetical protein CMQ44_05630 [Gammaproteobacteria bacterium]|nr:hypothetical protein [Gammaproteobacteria bacterium]